LKGPSLLEARKFSGRCGVVMTIELESMAVEMPEVEGHPNRAAFRGVLTVVDAASTRAPAGSKGHRVILSRRAAEEALPSLIGMALDFAPSFDGHDQRRKVGVITSAELVGRNLEVGGYLYARDFPDVVEEIQAWGGRPTRMPTLAMRNGNGGNNDVPRREGENAGPRNELSTGEDSERKETTRVEGISIPRQNVTLTLSEAVASLRELLAGMRRGSQDAPRVLRAEGVGPGIGPLGMSYEVTDVSIADQRAHVWILNHVTFTGAAILRRDRAAYGNTWIGLED
jgi:hypothetical protein